MRLTKKSTTISGNNSFDKYFFSIFVDDHDSLTVIKTIPKTVQSYFKLSICKQFEEKKHVDYPLT